MDCDFSANCTWKNVGTAFNWTVVKAVDGNTLYNGPTQDHSGSDANGGYYLVADSLFIRVNSSLGRIESPPMNDRKCVEFWYYMYGPQVVYTLLNIQTIH